MCRVLWYIGETCGEWSSDVGMTLTGIYPNTCGNAADTDLPNKHESSISECVYRPYY